MDGIASSACHTGKFFISKLYV